MISKPIKKFAKVGIIISILILAIPVSLHFTKPHFFKKKFAEIRSEQLSLQALRKPAGLPTPTGSKPNTTLPQELQLQVPFTPQAPTANWDELHNEACEEASAIMAHAYFSGIKNLPPELVEKEISKLTDWQKQTFGYYLSINTPEAIRMVKEVYNLEATSTQMSKDAVKRALNENKLVLLPANGQLLNNPNFKVPGPIYHMLVITGYEKDKFITNDPGTRKGFNYEYDYETLYNAAGNWNHAKHEVDLQDKQIIIVSK